MASSHVTKCPLSVTYGLCFSCRTMGMGCEDTELACELATVAFEGEVDNINVAEGHEVFEGSAQIAVRLDPRVASYFPAHLEPCSKPPIETYLPPSQSPKMKKQQPRNLDHSKYLIL
jgi:hypothetical protein